jgi:hypothetical protein
MLLNCTKIKQGILKESLHGDDEELNQFQEIGSASWMQRQVKVFVFGEFSFECKI